MSAQRADNIVKFFAGYRIAVNPSDPQSCEDEILQLAYELDLAALRMERRIAELTEQLDLALQIKAAVARGEGESYSVINGEIVEHADPGEVP